jgi:hypothetical protein
MNLHGIAASAVGAVNPFVDASLQASDGYTTGNGGKRTPKYLRAVRIKAQVQALSYRDLAQVDGLNLNGTRRKLYLYGEVDGVVRSIAKGGDLVTLLSDQTTWLVVQVLEQWPDWCSVAVTLQDGN